MRQGLTLPYPPSVNRYWKSFRGRVVLSADARKYKERVKLICNECGVVTASGPIEIWVHVFRPRKIGDLDNTMKALFDSLNGSLWVDDSQITIIHAFRHDDKSNPRVEVLASELRQEGTTSDSGVQHAEDSGRRDRPRNQKGDK